MADKRAAHLISFHTPKTTQYAAVFATVGDRLVRKLEALLSLHIRIRERARYVPPHYRITHSDQIIFGKCLLSRIGKTIYQDISPSPICVIRAPKEIGLFLIGRHIFRHEQRDTETGLQLLIDPTAMALRKSNYPTFPFHSIEMVDQPSFI